MNKATFHPLAKYFPMLPEDEFEQLKESIKNFGLLEPITTLNGMILDGRNRYRACIEVEVEPRYHEYQENSHKPIDFVVAANMRRRHLLPAQKVQISIDIYGEPTYRGMQKNKTDELPQGSSNKEPRSYADVARETGVSAHTVSRVVSVQDDEELKQQLRDGKIETTVAQRAMKQKVANTRLKQFEQTHEGKVPETWQGLYALAPNAADIAHDLGRIINGVDKWLSNKYGLDRIDPKGHTPLLITKTEKAIEELNRFKLALEELRDE